MKPQVKRQLSIVFTCLWILCLLCGLSAVAGWSQTSSKNEKFKTNGFVAQALVFDRGSEIVRTEKRKGKSKSKREYKIYVIYDQKATIPYADLGTKIPVDSLPPPPSQTPENTAMLFVDSDQFEELKIGTATTVVFTPDAKGLPELVADVRSYSPDGYFMAMGISGVAAVVFFFWGRRIRKI